MINFFIIFGVLVQLELAYNLPLTETGLNKVPENFETSESSLLGDETVNGFKQQTPVLDTSNLLEIASITLPVLTFIHESESGPEILPQIEGDIVGADTPQLTPKQAKVPEVQGILKYPEVEPEVFAPIPAEPIHPQEPILLPLITDDIQTLSLLPMDQAYKSPANWPEERERTISDRSLVQTGPAASMEDQKHLLPHTTTKQNFNDSHSVSTNSQQPAVVYTAIASPSVEESQKTVSSSRQEVVHTVEESGNANLVLEVTTHAPGLIRESPTGVTGGLYHHLVLVGSSAQAFSQDQFSIQQTSDKAVDKLCLILTKK